MRHDWSLALAAERLAGYTRRATFSKRALQDAQQAGRTYDGKQQKSLYDEY
jgi:hypothetical protein